MINDDKIITWDPRIITNYRKPNLNSHIPNESYTYNQITR